jgi:methylmalonyl-CoA decarboxylase
MISVQAVDVRPTDGGQAPSVDLRILDRIGILTMQDAAHRNAVNSALVHELLEALSSCESQKLRVIILRAKAGSTVWSAGHDVHELPETRRDPLGWGDCLRMLVRGIEEIHAPVMALIDGGVWGGACEVALACDILIATPRTTFAITPARLGVPYNASGMLTFLNRIPRSILNEMAYTADPIDAHRLVHLGIINHVVPADQIDDFTLELARRISRNAPLAVAVMKEELRLLQGAHPLGPETFERVQALRRVVYDSQDYKEGLHAFLDKRVPVFVGE